MGEVQVKSFIGTIKIQFTAVVARDARRRLLSGTQLRTKGCMFTFNQHESFLTQPKAGQRVTKSREGNRDTLKVVCLLKPRETQSVTSLMLERELENVRRELRNLKTGQHENKRGNVEREMTADERTTHERTRHATYDPRTHPRKTVAGAAYFDCALVKNNQQSAEVKILVGAGPRGETSVGTVHRKGAKFEDLELFLKMLQTRYGHIFQCAVTKKSACTKLYTVQQEDVECQQQ